MTLPVLVICADSVEYLRTLPDDRFHAVVTDPPYGLGDPPDPADVLRQWANRGDWSPRKGKGGGFMGCTWDRFVPGPALWREVFRVLRPGAYCAVFAATRTMDWMSLSLRFAGFDIVDTLMWVFGEGFPKGGDVGKRIDAMLGAAREVVGMGATRCVYLQRGESCRCGDTGERAQSGGTVHQLETTPATPEAAAWDDCSTTLKPGYEPIILAQKPYRGSVARNCVDFGAGALRTGACRVEATHDMPKSTARGGFVNALNASRGQWGVGDIYIPRAAGRWPANLILDEVAAAMLDEQSGFLHAAGNKNPSREMFASSTRRVGFQRNNSGNVQHYDKGGGASRFFYCPKATARDRDEGLGDGSNAHPTVKPERLMRWLVRLVTPPWGEVLDPFGGSGSTGKAAALEGLRGLVVEREPEHAAVAERRVAAALRRAGVEVPESASVPTSETADDAAPTVAPAVQCSLF